MLKEPVSSRMDERVPTGVLPEGSEVEILFYLTRPRPSGYPFSVRERGGTTRTTKCQMFWENIHVRVKQEHS